MARLTIIGAHVLEPGLAVAWADSEAYDTNDRSVGHVSKLYVNPCGLVFTMAGFSAVSAKGGACVIEATTLRAALNRLPWVLRRASEQAAMASRRPELHSDQHAALIGFDREAGAMVAYRFTPAECFVPMLDFEQSVPCPPGSHFSPAGPFQVQAIAERQMDQLREAIPNARGGPLHVAVIRPDSITCNRLCDLSETAPAALAAAPVKETADVY